MRKNRKDRKTDPAKAAAKTAVAVAASASVLVGGLFNSPADLVNDPEGPGIDRAFPPAAVEVLSDGTEEGAPDDKTEGGGDGSSGGGSENSDAASGRSDVRQSLRAAVQRVPKAVRAAAGVPMWIAGWLLTGAFRLAWGGVVSPVLSFLAGWLILSAFVLLAVVCAVKAVFPNLPLRKILNKKTVLAVLISCGVLSAIDTFLPLFWPEYRKISRVVRIAGSGLTAICVSLPFFRHKMRKTARRKAGMQEK